VVLISIVAMFNWFDRGDFPILIGVYKATELFAFLFLEINGRTPSVNYKLALDLVALTFTLGMLVLIWKSWIHDPVYKNIFINEQALLLSAHFPGFDPSDMKQKNENISAEKIYIERL